MKNVSVLVFALFLSFNVSSQIILTPLQESGYTQLSSHEQLCKMLVRIAKKNPVFRIDTIGKSVKDREILMLTISNGDTTQRKLKVLLFAQQHGDEPSGKEGLLFLAKHFADGQNKDILKVADIYIVPQLNPDGGEINTRLNAVKLDLNRNHLILTALEVKALHQVFDKLKPEVTLDMHEYFPYDDTTSNFKYIKYFDEQFGMVSNCNVDKQIISFCRKTVMPFIKKTTIANGFSFAEYMPGSAFGNKRIRLSTTDIDDGRNSFGIQGTMSFIAEGRNGRDSIENIERRAKGQFTVALALLQIVKENSSEILNIVDQSRKQLLVNQNKAISVQMEHFRGDSALKMTLYKPETKSDTMLIIKEFHSEVKSLLDIKLPDGYLVSKNDSLMVSFLKNKNIQYVDFETFKKGRKEKIAIVKYTFLGDAKVNAEETDFMLPKIKLEKLTTKIAESNYYYISTNQLKSTTIALAFEPQSMFGLSNYSLYSYLKKTPEIW